MKINETIRLRNWNAFPISDFTCLYAPSLLPSPKQTCEFGNPTSSFPMHVSVQRSRARSFWRISAQPRTTGLYCLLDQLLSRWVINGWWTGATCCFWKQNKFHSLEIASVVVLSSRAFLSHTAMCSALLAMLLKEWRASFAFAAPLVSLLVWVKIYCSRIYVVDLDLSRIVSFFSI